MTDDAADDSSVKVDSDEALRFLLLVFFLVQLLLLPLPLLVVVDAALCLLEEGAELARTMAVDVDDGSTVVAADDNLFLVDDGGGP